MSVLQRCLSYKESNKGSKERQGPTLGVRFTELPVLWRCPLRESRLYTVDKIQQSLLFMLDTVYLIASIHFWHLKTFILDKGLQLMSVPSSQETISFN